MPSIFKSLNQIQPTDKGLKYIKTEAFDRVCQSLAHDMLAAGKSWPDVESQLRYTATVAIMPRRNYDSDEIADFYKRNFQVIDAALRTAVIEMKKAAMEIEKHGSICGPYSTLMISSQGVPLATTISQLQNAMIELSRTIEALRAEVKALREKK